MLRLDKVMKPLKGSCGESARIREQQPARSTSYEQYGFVRLHANPCDFIRNGRQQAWR
jgi:hypothetical protein